jgi:GNAT superfamily N-acetyltransferase
MDTDVIFRPTRTNLEQIKDWLIAERRETGEGFYCNWDVIESSYEQEELCCIVSNTEAVGFAVWGKYELSARLDIVEIRPDLRGRGFGRILVEECFNHFRNLGLLVVDLECQPPTSEPVWRRLGFRDFPQCEGKPSSKYNNSINLYRPLIEPLEPNNQSEAIEVLELWDREPWENPDSEPTWTWEILRQKGTQELVKPIIHPCDKNWRLRWRKGNKFLIDEKVKRFSEDSSSWGEYVIVTELLENPNNCIGAD